MSDDTAAAFGNGGFGDGPPPPPKKPVAARDRIIDAVMELAAERDWSDFGIPEIVTRAGVSLADFRDAFPSKGAVLGGLSKRIDRVVLEGTTDDLKEETAKERLFDVLMRRLDAMAPYKAGLECVAEWVKGDLAAAAALNQVALNSMRFMLAAAGIDADGRTGAIKLQGLVVAWARILNVWFEDGEPGLAKTMAALDRELKRGAMLAGRVDDIDRLASPLRLLGRAVMDTRRRRRERKQADNVDAADPAVDR
jgi:AcrR family transcriptional regulator